MSDRPSKRARREPTVETESDEDDSREGSDGWADHIAEDEGDSEPSMEHLHPSIVSVSGDGENGKFYKDCGCIETLELHNFMCHSNFEIDFDPRINFIEGRNGSGKSAIMTAIVVALGGRASLTSRGQTISAFIKAGESQCKIVIKLCNDNGFNRKASYKFDEYGASIIVERIIYQNGSSAYKLKSASGRIVSTKKAELEEIISHFNIQTDNPVCVLNQEVSRNFLNSKNPKDKYDFFMRATQLEQLKRDYSFSEKNYENNMERLKRSKAIEADIRSELKQLSYKVKMFNDIVDRQKSLRSLKREAVWAAVNQKEKEIKKTEEEVRRYKMTIEKTSKLITELKAVKGQHDKRKAELSTEIQAIVNGSEAYKAEVEEKKRETMHIKTKKAQNQSEINRLQHEIKALQSVERSLRNKIAEIRKQSITEVEKENRATKLEALEIELTKLTKEYESLTMQRAELGDQERHIVNSFTNLKDDTTHIQNQLRRKEQEINEMQAGSSNKLRRFGEHYVRLVEEIEKEHRHRPFTHKPLGPFGYYMDVPEEAALAVECCLKNLVFAFWADNKRDADRLRQITNRVMRGKKPDIITRKKTARHNVRGREVQSNDHHSMLDLITFKHDVIANALIDRAFLETILYIPDPDVAINLLSNLATVPRNCRQAYTQDGANMYPVTQRSSFRNYVNEFSTRSRYLQADVQNYVQDAKLALVAMKESLETKTKQLNEKLKEKNEFSSKIKTTEAKLNQIRPRMRTITLEINEMKSVVETTSVEIFTLEEELHAQMEKISEAKAKLDHLLQLGVSLAEQLTEASTEYSELERKRQEHIGQRVPLGEELTKLNIKLTKVEDELRTHQQNVKETKNLKEATEKRVEVLTKQLQEAEQKAMEKIPQRIETNKSPEQLEQEIEELREFLAEKENEIGNRQQITEEYERKLIHYKQQCANIEAYEALQSEIKAALEKRAVDYVGVRRYITYSTCQVFQFVLEQVNFKGKIFINHKEKEDPDSGKVFKAKTLEIRVNPKGNNQSVECKDTRSLSGGERAYSTVAFILSLWESCETPFRILDEFDCFMDMVTREIALETFIEAIKQRNSKQYIFLTPLDIRHIAKDKTIKIHKMLPPERNA